MLSAISNAIWGAPLIIFILAMGIYFTFKLKFIQLRGFLPSFRALLKSGGEGEISPLAALATSLAAMLGTGNIVGVACAISLGGAGSVFWMVISGFFGMALSYVEGYLAIKYRESRGGHVLGGAFMYIEKSIGKFWAKLFAICAMLAALLGIGTMTQSNSIAAAFCDLHKFRGNTFFIAAIVTAICAYALLGGIKRISKISGVIVPVMSAVYIIATCAVLLCFYEKIPLAISEILNGALNIRAAGAGAVGAAVRYGMSRGVFSNEAGMGSAAFASAASKASADEQGLCTMIGTFIDTVLMCSLTGLALIVSGAGNSGLTGVEMTNFAYNAALPGVGKVVVSLSLMMFALASIIGWSYYGEQCVVYLASCKAVSLYRVLYVVFVFCGSFMSIDSVWQTADILNGLMAIPNLFAIFIIFCKKKRKSELCAVSIYRR